MKYKETYNLWLGQEENYSYMATVVASDMEEAATRAIGGCGLKNDKLDLENMTYNSIPICRGNPLLNK